MTLIIVLAAAKCEDISFIARGNASSIGACSLLPWHPSLLQRSRLQVPLRERLEAGDAPVHRLSRRVARSLARIHGVQASAADLVLRQRLQIQRSIPLLLQNCFGCGAVLAAHITKGKLLSLGRQSAAICVTALHLKFLIVVMLLVLHS